VLHQGVGLILAGSTMGLVCALAVSRLMTGVLYGVEPADPVTFVSVTAVLVTVALFACYVPARRAICVDPLTALRHD